MKVQELQSLDVLQVMHHLTATQMLWALRVNDSQPKQGTQELTGADNPAAVVLAAVMQAVAISRTNEYNKERVLPHNPSVSYGTDITVQEQSNQGNAKVVSLETGTDCPGWSR